MIIHRISGQKRKTLIEFYEPFDAQTDTAKIALPAMQEFLRRLMEIEGPELYAFTSHYRLNFVASDSHTVPVIARVIPGCTPLADGSPSPLIHVIYPPNEDVGRDDRSWPLKTAESVDDAIALLFAAFRESAFSPYNPD
ncbi:MAG TPA: hypothetical protein DDW52_19620 [Planctomycetaceae bacterium]|nr:hypothetical protein [Planctomycetaceae bacterium]